MPVDPGLQLLLDAIAANPTKMHDGSPADARAMMRSITVDLVTDESRVPVGSTEDLEVAGRPARLYRPEGEGPWPTLVYLHGGGFVVGDLDTHDQTCRRFCRDAGLVVLSVDYRLAPEDPYPAGVEDALAAVEWAAAHRDELGGTDLLAVGGDSAGGNIAAVVAQERRDLVSAQVLLYPVVDFASEYPSKVENAEGYFLDMPLMAWFHRHYTGPEVREEHLTDARLSPFLGDVDGVAPALVVTAEYDPLRDEGEAYADKLAAAGVHVDRVRYDGMIHGFLDMGALSPAAAAAVDDVVARTASLLGRIPSA